MQFTIEEVKAIDGKIAAGAVEFENDIRLLLTLI